MAYIGLPPKANFTSGLLDRFTSTTGTTVTLTHDISSENDIVVFVNFVKQDSTTYSVGGTGNKTLTLGGTLVSSDIVEVHYLNIVGQTVAPSSGSVGSSQLTADVITGQTALAVAPDSTDELLISDGGTLKRIDVSLVGGTNTPNFRAINSSTQNLSGNGTTFTKVQLDTEQYDTASAYDNSSNYRFTVPSGQAGKYFISAQIGVSCNQDHRQVHGSIYKNGSGMGDMVGRIFMNGSTLNDGEQVLAITGVLDLSVGDYLELYGRGYDTIGGGTVSFTAGNSSLQGFKLI